MSFNNSSVATTSRGSSSQIDPVRATINFYVNIVGYVYLVPFICICGVGLNLMCLRVLCSKELKGNIYKYFILKTISELILVVCGALLPISSCTNCATFQTLAPAIYRGYIFSFVVGACFNISNMCEIALSYDRLIIFKQKSKWFPKIGPRRIIAFILLFSLLLLMPYIFTTRIVELANNPGKFGLELTPFGRSMFMKVYGQVIALRALIFFIALLWLNTALLFEYKKYSLNRVNIISTAYTKTQTQMPLNKSNIKIAANSTSNVNTKQSNEALSDNHSSMLNSSLKQMSAVGGDASEKKKQKTTTMKKEDSEKRLAYSIMCCCAIYGFNRLSLTMASMIGEIEMMSSSFTSFSNFYQIFGFSSRSLAYLVFSLNLFILALFNKAFKTHLSKTIQTFTSRIF
jgi:hypothetical protein